METQAKQQVDKQLWRDLLAYWFLGLCNNYGYVVMLSAAHDIIGQFDSEHSVETYNTYRQCYYMSTGAVLLADIIPSLTAKMLMPFIPFCVNIRIGVAISFTVTSFILVAIATKEWVALLGVALTSANAGIGEATFMAYTSSFNKNVVSTWSSGTGGAGIIGSVSYASLIGLGFSPRNTLLFMLIVPIVEAMTFWILLRNPKDIPDIPNKDFTADDIAGDVAHESLKEKFMYIQNLLIYMIPLGLVYFLEYFINQGLFELVYFEDTFLDKPAQYRWFNVVYQIGVFISRSSVNIVQFPRIWIMSIFQFINVIYFLTEVLYYYTPSIWITFTVIMWEGLLGGGAYVNTFYRMSKEITPLQRRYAMSIVVLSDTFGVMMAGFLAMPVHNIICRMPIK